MPKVSQEHMEGRRRQILAAAGRCFASVGFHAATMQDVIKASGLSAGAIYNHFSSKEEIIAAIADERHAREAALCRAAEAEADPSVAIQRLARAFFGHLSDEGQEEERCEPKSFNHGDGNQQESDHGQNLQIHRKTAHLAPRRAAPLTAGVTPDPPVDAA